MTEQRAVGRSFAGLHNRSEAGAGILAIDFEASCLPRHGRSYPIEVGIADGRGTVRSWLIRPAAQWEGWTWTEEAQALHGLTRERLLDEGLPVTTVAVELSRAIAGHRLVADSEIDGTWMRTLMEAAKLSPVPVIEHVAMLVGRLGLTEEEVRACADRVRQQAFPRHRAGDDARWLAALVAAFLRASQGTATSSDLREAARAGAGERLRAGKRAL